MDRNSFLRTASLSLAALFTPSVWEKLLAAGDGTINIRDYFKSDNKDVMQLAENVFDKCIFHKVMPPEGTLRHHWISPGGGYKGQWIWDTMFVTDLLSIFPGQTEVIREVFQNYRDFQTRWNLAKPDYARDMIPCMIEPNNLNNWVNYPAYSQIPILAWGLEQIYTRNQDIQLIKDNIHSIESFHEWYWRERDVTNIGMVGVGSYSSVIQHARFETYDFDGTLDHLKLTRHPTRKSETEGEWYGDVLVTGNTSYLVMAEKSLVRLAHIAGDDEMVKRRKVRIKKSEEAVRKYMWDEESGLFLAVHRDTLEKIKETSIGCWMPLYAGIPTKAMAKRMASVLESKSWQTPLTVPTIPQDDPRYKPDGFWRGDVWPASTYQVVRGLKDYGYDDLAARIADNFIANAIKNGVSERYDSQTGKGLGVNYLGMSCTLITMMLEGITKNYRINLV